MKKMKIGNSLYTVVSMNEYTDSEEGLYNPRTTAIETHGAILPIRTGSDMSEPGIYYNNGCDMVADVVKPTPEQYSDYDPANLIDYSNVKSIQDIINNNDLVRNIERDILTSKDNILSLRVSDRDTPAMRAVKTAINMKQVDKKAYELRFPQYQNDMRLLKGDKITLQKTVDICNNFDIEAILYLRDKNPEVPNPMGNEVSVVLTEEVIDQ